MKYKIKENIMKVHLNEYEHGDRLITKNNEYVVIKKLNGEKIVKNINNI